MAKLDNKKWEMFCHEYIKDRNGSRSYRETYKSKNNKSAGTSAERLLKNDEILLRIDELQQPILEKCEIDTAWIIEKHKELIDYGTSMNEFKQMKDSTCVNKSLDALAKIKGSYAPEKKEVNSDFSIIIRGDDADI